jgi:hypothetical protein
VDAGRAVAASGMTDGLAYFEWSAPDDAEPGDPETWRGCMPALGRTVDERTIAADMAAMAPAQFRRAYLNQWPDETGEGWRVIARCVDGGGAVSVRNPGEHQAVRRAAAAPYAAGSVCVRCGGRSCRASRGIWITPTTGPATWVRLTLAAPCCEHS